MAKELIKDSIMALKDNVDLEELYLNPSIYSDNESLNNAINQMNTITSTTIRYVGNTLFFFKERNFYLGLNSIFIPYCSSGTR